MDVPQLYVHFMMTLSSAKRTKDTFSFLALFVLALTPFICKGQHENTCNVVPKDQFIEKGSDIEIVCHTSCIRDRIFWTLNNTPVDESLSYTINSSHTVLSLRNFTHPSATVQCHNVATEQVLGGTNFRTYSKPSKISCILESNDQVAEGVPQWLTCHWEHQSHSSLKINYTVIASSSGSPKTLSCNSTEKKCTFKGVDVSGVIFMGSNITVTVKAKTDVWEAYSDPHEFNPYHILKIIRPTEVTTTSSDQLSVNWTRSHISKECHCQVKYGKADGEGNPEDVMNITLKPNETRSVTIEVESCINYKVKVRCALDKAPWSSWSQEKTVVSNLKKDFQMLLWRVVAEQDKNGVRKVRVMWAETPSTCEDKFTNTVKQTPYKEPMTTANIKETLCGNSTCDVNEDAHWITLSIFRNGSLLMEESVYVPAFGESLPQVTDIETSTLEGTILVTWKAPVQPVSGYMIDWTHNGKQYYWKETKDTNTTLFGLLDKEPYNITVTPLFGNKTGNSTQVSQICSRVGDPGNVTITSVQVYDKSAFVSWAVNSIGACSSVVINYTVVIHTQGEPEYNITVNSTKQYLKDLKPDTQYIIYVIATSPTGSTKSNEMLIKTKLFDPKLITVLSVCGSITTLFVLSLGLCCAIRWKKFKEKLVPNPGLSSVALWPWTTHPKQFSNPSESLCDKVYTEETQRTSTSSLATDCNGDPASDQTGDYTGPAIAPVLHVQDKDPVEPVEAQHPAESTTLLFSENDSFSPYISQSSVETPAQLTRAHCKLIPVKQQEKTTPVAVYVTLDMLEQGQGK